MSNTIDIHIDSVEYLYLPFTVDVNPVSLTGGQAAFSKLETLVTPTWIAAAIVVDQPHAGRNALRVLFGTDWTPTEAGYYYWWGKFTDTPETPIERGPSRIRVYE